MSGDPDGSEGFEQSDGKLSTTRAGAQDNTQIRCAIAKQPSLLYLN